MILITFFFIIRVILARHLLRLHLLLPPLLLEYLADHGHLMLLLPSVDVPLQSGVSSVHYVPLLYHVVSHLRLRLVVLLQTPYYHLLLLSLMINGQNLFLQYSQVLLDGGLGLFDKEVDLLDEELLLRGEQPRGLRHDQLLSLRCEILRLQNLQVLIIQALEAPDGVMQDLMNVEVAGLLSQSVEELGDIGDVGVGHQLLLEPGEEGEGYSEEG